MNKAKNIYKLAWIIWIIGSLLITASWFSIVPIDWGQIGFVIALIGALISGYPHWVARKERRSSVHAAATNRLATFDDLETLFKEATRLLDRAAEKMRDLNFEPEKNLRRVGEAIVAVSEIRGGVYIQRPDLMPQEFKK
jgi:hypothetical protein